MLKKGQLHHHFFLLAYPKFAQDQLSNFGAFPLPSSLNSKSCNSRCSWWPVQIPGRKGMESWKQVSATKRNAAWWYTYPTPLKNMSSSMGRMTSHIYIYIYTIYYGKKMFQTTNQNGFEFHLPWSIRITWILKVDFDLIVTFQGRNFNEVSARLEKTWSIAVLSVHLPGMLDNSDAPRYVLVRGFSGQLHPSLAVAPEFPWRSYFLHVFCQNTLKYVWLCTSQIFKHTILPLTIYGDVVMRLTP